MIFKWDCDWLDWQKKKENLLVAALALALQRRICLLNMNVVILLVYLILIE